MILLAGPILLAEDIYASLQ